MTLRLLIYRIVCFALALGIFAPAVGSSTATNRTEPPNQRVTRGGLTTVERPLLPRPGPGQGGKDFDSSVGCCVDGNGTCTDNC